MVKGNGSCIQQLVFASHEKVGSTWLAVRYQGAISILKPKNAFPLGLSEQCRRTDSRSSHFSIGC